MKSFCNACLLFIVCLFLGASPGQAVSSPTDSLQALLQTENNPRLRAQYYFIWPIYIPKTLPTGAMLLTKPTAPTMNRSGE